MEENILTQPPKNTPSKKGPKLSVLVVILVIVLFVLCALGAFAFYYFYTENEDDASGDSDQASEQSEGDMNDDEAGEENESEVVCVPGGDPVRDKPVTKADESAFFLLRRIACSWRQRDLMYTNHRDQRTRD